MGISNFILHDFDKVEAHNLASQAYGIKDVGRFKVSRMKKAIKALNPDATVKIFRKPYIRGLHSDLVVCAVDSLIARRAIAWALRSDTFVIDGRMGGGQVEVWAQSAKDWVDTIPESADDDPCSARYISYTSYMIAGMIANTVKRHLNGELVPSMVLLHANTMEVLKS